MLGLESSSTELPLYALCSVTRGKLRPHIFLLHKASRREVCLVFLLRPAYELPRSLLVGSHG